MWFSGEHDLEYICHGNNYLSHAQRTSHSRFFRTKADEYVSGIPFNSHKKYGTPFEAWSVYEYRRRANFVQILPFMPVPIPRPPQRQNERRIEHHPSPPPSPSPSPSPISSPSHAPTSASPPPRTHRTHRTQPARQTHNTHHVSVQRSGSTQYASSISRWQNSVVSTSVRESQRGSSRVPRPNVTSEASTHHSTISIHTQNHGPRRIGIAYASGSVPLDQRILAGEDPWDGEANAFVVFHGSIPGIYETWYVFVCV